MNQDETVEIDETTLTPEMADAWAKVFLDVVVRVDALDSLCNSRRGGGVPTCSREADEVAHSNQRTDRVSSA